MIELYTKSLLALIGVIFLIQPAQAQRGKNNLVAESVDIDSFVIEKGTTRHAFSVENATKKLVLMNLNIGEIHTVILSEDVSQSNCVVSFVEDHRIEFLKRNVLRFNANKPIFELMLRIEDCKKSRNLNISVGCTSCESESARYAPPGIETDETFDPDQLIRDVFIGGDCFDVDSNSINFAGDDLARGYFFNGSSSINIEEGVILSTGNIGNSAGPNDFYNTGNSFPINGFDQDLADMIGSNSLYDVASLEFDFTPTTDQVSFEFVFASEEYCEYVNSTFNDVFGFFISGPGFNGPFSNNAENIAIVPGTNDYIAINTVNHLLNSNYYLNNIPSWQHDQIPSYLACENHTNGNGVAIEDIEFDGFTTVMTVSANVVACETYHIKLAIADVADAYFDSAVFLKANSFSAGATANVSAEVPDGSNSTNIAYEDCIDGFFVFERGNDDLSDSLVVHFNYSSSSTAIPGIDFQAFADSIVIPAGDSVYYLTVDVFSDLLIEGLETLILELDAPCSCNIPFIEMFINDYPELEVELADLTFCGPIVLNLEPIISGGIGNYTFGWSTSDSIEIIEVNTNISSVYTITVTDECGNTAEDISSIEIIEIPTATISGYEQVCPEGPNAEVQIEFTGDGPWNLEYSLNGVLQPPIFDISSNPFFLEVDELGDYLLNSVSHNGCEGQVQGAASVVETVFQFDAISIEESCLETSDGSIDVSISGGLGPYQFNWDNDAENVEDPENLSSGIYNLTLTDANGCSMISSVLVPLSDQVPIVGAGEDTTLNCFSTELVLSGSGNQGANFNYAWTTIDGNIVSGEATLSPLINQSGTYFLNITNSENNCSVVDEVDVFIDTIAPIPNIEVIGPLVLNCTNPTTVLDGISSEPFGILTFEWITNDGNIISNENMPNPEVNAAGTYQMTVTNTVNGCSAATSFYIDASLDLPMVSISNPMMLNCADTIFQLDAGNSSIGAEYEYSWETDDGNILNGNNTLFPSIDAPGFYTLIIQNTLNDCENSDGVEVGEDIEPPISEAGLQGELDCNDNLTTLDGSQSSIGTQYNYSWTTVDGAIISGEFSLNPVVGATGTYSLSVVNIQNECAASDEVIVTENLNVPTGLDVFVFSPECFGDKGSIEILTVFGGEGPYLYSIDDGENYYSNTIFQGLPSGNYNLIVQDVEGCQFEELVTIPQVYEVSISLDPEVELELGDSYQMDPIINIPLDQISLIVWSPTEYLSCSDCLNPIANPVENTMFTISVFDQNGCEAFANILLKIDKTRKIYIPNSFSPNGDGSNDVFLIYSDGKSVSKINRFQIFDRWGGKVFEVFDKLPNNLDFGWDGTFEGKTMNPSVFVYVAEIEFVDGLKILYKGDLTILE